MHPFDILEHTFGKGEVESSILSCSTTIVLKLLMDFAQPEFEPGRVGFSGTARGRRGEDFFGFRVPTGARGVERREFERAADAHCAALDGDPLPRSSQVGTECLIAEAFSRWRDGRRGRPAAE